MVSCAGIHFSIITRNVDYFYTCKFNWIPVSGHWDDRRKRPVLATSMTLTALSFQRVTLESRKKRKMVKYWDDIHLVVFSRLPCFSTMLNRYILFVAFILWYLIYLAALLLQSARDFHINSALLAGLSLFVMGLPITI